ncbi:hypothetical protein [Limnospira fusiformis]
MVEWGKRSPHFLKKWSDQWRGGGWVSMTNSKGSELARYAIAPI